MVNHLAAQVPVLRWRYLLPLPPQVGPELGFRQGQFRHWAVGFWDGKQDDYHLVGRHDDGLWVW
jgi:hypothetical protein